VGVLDAAVEGEAADFANAHPAVSSSKKPRMESENKAVPSVEEEVKRQPRV